MNKTFRSIWNIAKQAHVAAAETVSAKGKPSSGTRVAAVVTALMGGLLSQTPYAQTAPPVSALPTGGLVSAGQASIAQSGANMVITQGSQRAAINWNTFNVGSNAQVQFNQPSTSSVVLNRVLSSDPSQIFGRISANGQVILTNPSGVYFGASARVDVGGLLATTHSTSDSDFMAGKNRFERNGSTGSVVNEGELKAALGGYIALLAPEVRNQGAVIAQMGTVALASGEAVEIQFDSNNRLTNLRVEPSLIKALVDNRQAVQAPGGLIILAAQSLDRLQGGVIKNSGRIEANGLQQVGGRIVLQASHKVENSGSISATASAGTTAAESGPAGKIEISAPEIINSGSIGATGAGQFSAGSVRVQATNFTQTASGSIDLSAPSQGGQLSIQTTGKVQLQGSVSALATQDSTPAGTTSQGGQIEIAAQGDFEVGNASLDASGGQGGSIALRAKAPAQPGTPDPQPDVPGQGRLAIMGNSTLSTRGRNGNGGSTTLLGDHIELLDTTAIDASGATGGGNVLVGGDWQGSNGVYQATRVTMVSGTSINASATGIGNGGKVVLWSDVHKADSMTTAQGTLHAKGGLNGGDGGQIETSGHVLQTDGIAVSAAAVKGRSGEWLLDPYDVVIGTTASGTGYSANFTPSATSYIKAADIASSLNGNTGVTISTGASGSNTIFVSSAITATGGSASLTLTGGTIALAAGITTYGAQTYNGNVSVAATGVSLTSNNGDVTVNGSIQSFNNLVWLAAGGSYYSSLLSPGSSAATGTLSANSSVQLGDMSLTWNGSSYSFTLANNQSLNYFVVGGGGGGGVNGCNCYNGGGGGGGGGVTQGTASFTASNTYAVSIGAGGAGAANYTVAVGATGGSTNLTGTGVSVAAAGGGGGGSGWNPSYGGTPGTGGGAGGTANFNIAGGAGTTGPAFSLTGYTITGYNYGSGGGAGSGYGYAVGTSGGGAGGNGAGAGANSPSNSGLSAAGGDAWYYGSGGGGAYGPSLNGGSGYAGIAILVNNAAKALTINAGSGKVAVTGNISGLSDLTINSTHSASQLSGVISGSTNLTKQGIGTLILTGANTYTGSTTISAGTLQIGNGGTTGSIAGASAITNNGVLILNRSDNISIANTISGSGSVTKSGSNTLTLTANSSYTGATTISGGTLVLQNDAPTSASQFGGPGALLIQSASTSFTSTFNASGIVYTSTLGGLTIGSSTNTASITVGSTIGIAGPINIYGGSININANLSSTTTLLKSTGNISLAASKSVQTTGGSATFWADSDGNGTGYVQLMIGASVSTGGGDIVMGGGTNLATGYARGEATRDTDSEPTYTLYIAGVHFRSGVTLNSGGGNITLRGQNTGGNTNAISFGVFGNGTVINSGTGKISITGVAAGTGSLNAQGISTYNGLTLRSASTAADAITLLGDATGATGATSLGVNFSGLIEATGSGGGGISITGKATTATSYSSAVDFYGSALAASGPLSIVGDNAVTSRGIMIDAGATLGAKASTNVTSSSSTIALKGVSIVINAPSAGVSHFNTTGTVNLLPLDSANSFNAAQTFGNLGLDANVSGLTIGKSSNTVDTTIASAISIAGPITVYGGNIAVNADLTSTNLNSAIQLLASSGISNATGLRTVTTNGGAVLFASDTDGNDAGNIRFMNGLTIDSRLGLAGSKSTSTTGGGAITLAGGNLTGTGYAVGISSGAEGVRVDAGLTLRSGGGDINFRGKSWSGASSAYAGAWGVGFWNSSLFADSGTGKIYFEGISRDSGTNSYKIGFATNSSIDLKSAYAGADAIKIVGSNITSGGGYNHGVDLGVSNESSSAATYQSIVASGAGGGISIIGTANEWSVLIRNGTQLLANGGPINIKAGGLGAGGTASGLYLRNGSTQWWGSAASSTVTSSTSNLLIEFDKFDFAGYPNIATQGTMTWQSTSNAFSSTVNTNWFTWNTNNQTMTGLTIGKSSNTLDVNTSTNVTANGPIVFYGGNIDVASNLTSNLAVNGQGILLKASGGIIVEPSKTLQTNNGTLTLWADSDGVNAGNLAIREGVTFNTANGSTTQVNGGGAITLAGGTTVDATTGLPTGYAYSNSSGAWGSNNPSGVQLGAYTAGSGYNNDIKFYSGGGNITVKGKASNGVPGISWYGGNSGSQVVNAGAGTITFDGQGLTAGHGIELTYFGGAVSPTFTSSNSASNAISLIGASASTGSNSGYQGVVTLIESGTGGISITGTANGTVAAVSASGLSLYALSGPIAITGIGGTGLSVGGTWGKGTLSSSSSNITLTSDAFTANNTNINTTGTITIQPYGNNFSATMNWPVGTWTLGSTISGLTLGKDIGSTAHTDTVTMGGSTSISGPVNVYAGTINVNANLNTSGGGVNGDILLKASGAITHASGVTVTTNGGDVTYWADSDGASGGYVWFKGGSIDTTAAANIVVSGGNVTSATLATSGSAVGMSTGNSNGITLDAVSMYSRGGNISLRGTSSTGAVVSFTNSDTSNNANTNGIRSFGSGVTIDSGAGLLNVWGYAQGSTGVSNSSNGLEFNGSTTLKSSSTASNAITLSGTATSTGVGNGWGLYLRSGDSILATNGGGISLTGSGSVQSGVVVGGNVLSTGGPITITGTGYGSGYYAVDVAGYLGLKALSAVTSSTSNIDIVGNKVTFSGATTISTSGTVTVEPYGSSFAAAVTLSNLTLDSSVSSLTVGKTTNTADITMGSAISMAGPISIVGGNITLNAGLTATGSNTITLQGTGNVTEGASGYASATNLVLLGGNATLTNANNAAGTLAASGVSGLSYVDKDALTIGTVGSTSGVSASGTVSIGTKTGDLTVAQNVATTSTSATAALVLNAGIDALAGASAGGNIIINGTPTFTTGSGGRATLFSGSIANSTGLASVSGLTAGTGRFRYNADETTNFATGSWTNLGTGLYAVYREQPTANISNLTLSMTYGDALPSMTATGTVNGDGSSYSITSAAYSSTSKLKASGTAYAITPALAGLGYNVTGASSGTLTVNTKALTIGGLSVANKAYDGSRTATISGTGTLSSGASTASDGNYYSGDAVSLTGTASGLFADKNVGSSKSVTLSGLTLSGLDATNYSIGALSSSASITAKTVSLSASKTYDGTLGLTGAVTIGTGVGSETLSYSGATASDAHVATSGKYIASITLANATDSSGGLASNYQLPTLSAAYAPVTINAKTLTTSASITAVAKTYDGLLIATGSSISGSVSGFVGSDSGSLNTSGITLAFSDAHVATASKTIGATGSATLSFTGAVTGSGNGTAGNQVAGASSDYSFSSPTITAVAGTINAKTLTASASITAVAKTYDGLLVATGSSISGSTSGALNGDSVALDTSGITLAFSDAHVATTGKTIGASGSVALGSLTAGGVGSKNGTAGNAVAGASSDYTLSAQPSITTVAGTINAKTLTASASITAVAKTYDGLLAATGSSISGSVSGFVGSDSGLLNTSAITLAYSDAHVATANKTISAAGSTTLSFTGAVTGSGNGTSGNQVAGVASDYSFSAPSISAVAGTINAATLTPTLTNTGVSKVYDGTASGPVGFTPTYSLSGLVSGDTSATLNATSATYNSANVASATTLTVGGLSIGSITGTKGSVASDYVLDASSKTVSATISKASLTVTANNDSKFLVNADTTNFAGVGYSGFVNGETSTVLGGTLAVTRSNAATNVAGNYSGVLVPSGLTSDNYTISYANGNYTIVPSNQLLVRVSDVSSTYGTATQYAISSVQYEHGGTVYTLGTGGVTGSSVAIDSSNAVSINDGASGTANFTLSPVSGLYSTGNQLRVGSYQLGASGITTQNSVNFGNTITVVGAQQVNAKGITASASGVSKVYDGTTSMSSVNLALSTVEANDVVTVTGMGAFASRNVGTGLNYTVSGLSLTSADAGNYYLTGGTSFSGSNGVITQRPLTLTFAGTNKVYDGNTSTTVTASDNRISGDALTITQSAAFADKNVGTGKTVNVSSIALSGADAGNYQTPSATAQTSANITRLSTVSWTGGATGNWFDPANWAGGAVPDLSNVAGVSIPTGVTVTFDTTAAVSPANASQAVNINSLGTAGTLNQVNGALAVGAGGIALQALTQSGGTLTNAGATTLSSYNQSGGSFSGTGNFSTAQLTQTNGSTALQGTLTVTQSYVQGLAGSISVGGDTSITATSGGVVLGNLNTSGSTQIVSTSGDISQVAGTAVVSGGATALSASNGATPATLYDIVLDGTANDFQSTVNANGKNVTLRDANSLTLGNVTTAGYLALASTGALNLGTSHVGEALAVNSGNGNITQTGALNVNGASVLNAGSGSLTLNNPLNNMVNGVTVTAASSSITGDRKGDAEAAAAAQAILDKMAADKAAADKAAADKAAADKAAADKAAADKAAADQAAADKAAADKAAADKAAADKAAADKAAADKAAADQAAADKAAADQAAADLAAAKKAADAQAAATASSASTAQAGVIARVSQVVTTLPGTNSPTTAVPQALALTATSSSVASSTSASSTSAGSNTASNAVNNGVVIDLRGASSSNPAIMAAVSLPKGVSTTGTGFSFELPESVKSIAQSDTQPKPSMPDGAPLPSWLKFNAQDLRFEASAIPDGAFPIQLAITIGSQRVLVVISERTE